MRLRSFLIFLLLLALVHAYVSLRLVPEIFDGTPGRVAGAVALVLSWVLFPVTVLDERIASRRIRDLLVWLGGFSMGLFSSLLWLTLLRDILLGATFFALPADEYQQLRHVSALAVPVLSMLVSLIGLFYARRRAHVVDVIVPIANLPAALNGFRIVQITDVHVGPTIKRGYVKAIVDKVNELQPDLVAVTGDLIDGDIKELAGHTAPLARLSGRHGVYYVTGNHEYYSGVKPWIREFGRLGMKVLSNEHVLLNHDGAVLLLAGVTDYSAGHFDPQNASDPAAAIAGAPAGVGAKVLLAHQPRSAPAAAAAGFDLQISGHTHGGQFWPWTLFVGLQQPFTSGLNRLNDLWIYTSRGTGYWGPPNRFGVPSEITRIQLVPAA